MGSKKPEFVGDGAGPGQDGSCSRAHRLGAALRVEGQGGASLISHAGLGEGAWAKPGPDTQNCGRRKRAE